MHHAEPITAHFVLPPRLNMDRTSSEARFAPARSRLDRLVPDELRANPCGHPTRRFSASFTARAEDQASRMRVRLSGGAFSQLLESHLSVSGAGGGATYI